MTRRPILIQAGSGASTFGMPNSPGVTKSVPKILYLQNIITLIKSFNYLKQTKLQLLF